MYETSARLLRLLALLQSRREWTGAELADQLGVTGSTVRNEIERLRQLGYPVHAVLGVRVNVVGYQLGSVGALPPLLLDEDEAVAVVVGLRATASGAGGGAVAGISESAVRALAKLEQVLPSPVRRKVHALAAHLVA